MTGENDKYNHSKAAHLYPPFSYIPRSAKNYKIALALTIIYAMLLACYYWMWARRDWHSFYDVIQNMVFLFTFLFFVLRAFRIRQYSKGEKDQAAIRNLRSIDAIGLKVMAGAAAVIAFASAIADLEGRIAGYALVGTIFALTVARFLALCLMSRNAERR